MQRAVKPRGSPESKPRPFPPRSPLKRSSSLALLGAACKSLVLVLVLGELHGPADPQVSRPWDPLLLRGLWGPTPGACSTETQQGIITTHSRGRGAGGAARD